MKVIRMGIYLLLGFAVLASGAVEVWSQSVLEIGAAALFLLWAIVVYVHPEASIHWNPLLWPLVAYWVLGCAQILFRWSVYPYLTQVELLKIAAYILLFFLACQAFREKVDLKRLAWFLLFFAFAVALFGIAQHFVSNGKIYWFREYPTGGQPFGPYVNRNHFAGLMELLLPVGLSLIAFGGFRREQLPLGGLLTVVPIGALFISGSRGGILSFLLELGALGLILWLRARKMRLGAAAVVLVLTAVFVVWLGFGPALGRFAQIHPGEISRMRRVTMLEGTWRIFLDHIWRGTGLGTLVAVYPRYETYYDGKLVDHAHNDYIETLANSGVLGALCALGFLVLLFVHALSNVRSEQSRFSIAIHVGAVVACIGLLFHSLFDFNLHIPANALFFLLQSSVATAPPFASEIRRHRPHAMDRVSPVDIRTASGS